MQVPGFGEKLRAVFGLSPTVLCLTGMDDDRIRDANDAFLSTSGYTRDEILGHTPVELGLWVDPFQRDEGLHLLKAGRPVRNPESRFRMKSGAERVMVLSADVVMFDGEACILSALTDITERTRAEAALRESERRFMVAFHSNPRPLPITSPRDHRHPQGNQDAPCPPGAAATVVPPRPPPRGCATAGIRGRRCWGVARRTSASGQPPSSAPGCCSGWAGGAGCATTRRPRAIARGARG